MVNIPKEWFPQILGPLPNCSPIFEFSALEFGTLFGSRWFSLSLFLSSLICCNCRVEDPHARCLIVLQNNSVHDPWSTVTADVCQVDILKPGRLLANLSCHNLVPESITDLKNPIPFFWHKTNPGVIKFKSRLGSPLLTKTQFPITIRSACMWCYCCTKGACCSQQL